MLVSRHMTRRPVTIAPNDTLDVAESRMRAGRFRRLPVVDGEQLIGILTDRDLRQHIGHLHETKVTGAMTEEIETVAPDATLEAATRTLLERRVGGLPVVENGKLVGILTTSDVLTAFLEITGASEAGTTRLDLVVEGERYDLSEASKIIASRGGEVLSIGTHPDRWDERPVFFVRMKGGDPVRIADELSERGFTVLGVHVGGPTPPVPAPATGAEREAAPAKG